MDKHDVLQRIMWENEPDYTYVYDEIKNDFMSDFITDLNLGRSPRQCVNGTFYHGWDVTMDKNGMEKFIGMIAGMLFEMEQGEVDPELAFGTAWDIRDFETGNYDDLFVPSDLAALKADIEKVKTYYVDHPVDLPDPTTDTPAHPDW